MFILVWIFTVALALFGTYVFTMRQIFALPLNPAEVETSTFARNATSRLAVQLAPIAAAHQMTSGVHILRSGAEAFAARIHLARCATVSIDAQYYIWDNDLTGIRLLSELQNAAARGVYVRLLLDDNGTTHLDQELAALHALPNVEVRMFNPFVQRRYRALNYSFDFFRLNRRMHNKSFTVDGAATILGGRNIGDVYFETGAAVNFIDLDVLAVGPVATDVSADFARYWASPLAIAVARLVPLKGQAQNQLQKRDRQLRDSPQGREYEAYLHLSRWETDIREIPFEWVRCQLFSDDPAKIQGRNSRDNMLIKRLFAAIGPPEKTVDLISAYFIPGQTARAQLAQYVAQGVRVRALTNALEATDVAIVHGGYAPFRVGLIADGIELYELRSARSEKRKVSDFELFDLSKAALHAKGLSIDRRCAFIGSLNFDPRSRLLNTEMGLLMQSARIAGDISDWLDDNLPHFAYRLSKSDQDHLIWTGEDARGKVSVYRHEPNSSWPLRMIIWGIGHLPFQWLL